MGHLGEEWYDGDTQEEFSLQRSTDADHLSVWSINLAWAGGLDCMTYASQQFFHRLKQYSHAPDIVLVQEVPYCDDGDCSNHTCMDAVDADSSAGTFLEHLWRATDGVEYSYVHAEGEPDERDGSNNMVVYRTDRLTYRPRDVLTWLEVVGDTCGVDVPPWEEDDSAEWQIAVRFWDELQARYVVAASVHFDHESNCAGENLTLMWDKMWERWNPANGDERDMIIVAGDFNQRPDGSGGYPRNREEEEVEDWYRHMSSEFGGALGFHDTVRVRNHDPEQDRDNPICAHWTRLNNVRMDPSRVDDCRYECEDGPGGAELTCADHHRIDYLWVRWENPDGSEMFVDERARIEVGKADQGYRGNTTPSRQTGLYSDHRAVHAIVRWR